MFSAGWFFALSGDEVLTRGLHRLELLRQAQENDGNSGH